VQLEKERNEKELAQKNCDSLEAKVTLFCFVFISFFNSKTLLVCLVKSFSLFFGFSVNLFAEIFQQILYSRWD
jgi:hypothetical protein